MSKIYTSQVIEICENGDAIIELGWMMTSKKILPTLKSNILKSLYLYASSQGLQIFGDSGMLDKSYFYNSSYVKVRD